MNIDKRKVLDAKKHHMNNRPLEESFNVLKQNDTPVNRMMFMKTYREQPVCTIRENLSYLYTIPTLGTNMLRKVLETSDFNVNELTEQRKSLEAFIFDLENANYINEAHIAELKECMTIIDKRIEYKNDINTIKEETLYDLYTLRVNADCIFESSLVDDMEAIIYNIDFNPETISDYAAIIRQIKMSHNTEHVSSFPSLLNKNTLLITNMNVSLSGSPRELITSMPVVIANKLVELKTSKSVIKTYNKILAKQREAVYKELKAGDNRKYVIYREYLGQIKKANEIFNNYLGILKESIAEMQPDIVIYDECCVEDIVAELEETIANMIFDDGEEFDDTVIENLTRIECKLRHAYSVQESILEEESKIVKGAVNTANKIQIASRKTVGAGRTAVKNVKRVATPINKIADPFVNAMNNTINKIKQMDADERRNRIITGQYRFKLFNFLTKGIMGLATGQLIAGLVTSSSVVNPIITIIGVITAIAIDRYVDRKARKTILRDLEGELKLVNEKIEDARSDNSRKEKYELMRIKHKLEKDIERIKFRLDN